MSSCSRHEQLEPRADVELLDELGADTLSLSVGKRRLNSGLHTGDSSAHFAREDFRVVSGWTQKVHKLGVAGLHYGRVAISFGAPSIRSNDGGAI